MNANTAPDLPSTVLLYPDNPAMWDDALSRLSASELLSGLQGDDDVTRVRRLQARFLTSEPQETAQLIQELEGMPGVLALGVRAMMLVELRALADVRALHGAFMLTSTVPLDLEGACYLNFAAGMLEPEERQAYALEHAALAFAQACGMSSRAQHIALDLERIRNLLGDGDPDRITQILNARPTPEARRVWGCRLKAGALLLRGRYREVLDVVDADHDSAEFARALLNLGSPQACADNEFSDLAALVWALRGMSAWPVDAPDARYRGAQPHGYAHLLRALISRRTTGGYVAYPELLGPQPPLMPDQRVLWAALAWEALVFGVEVAPAGVVLAALRTGQQGLHDQRQVAQLLRFLSPLAAFLVACDPQAPVAWIEQRTALPLLVGQHLLYGAQEIKLPGRTNGAQIMVIRALGEEASVQWHERRRVERQLEALNLPCEPINVAHVLQGLHLMRLASVGEQAAWARAVRAALDQMTGNSAQRLARRRFEPEA